MPDHVMPNPRVVPILWGHDYVANPATAKFIEQMVNDLVTGPFMNGMAQYGVRRGTVATPVVIDDKNPPATIVYTDTNNKLVDQITQKLISWIKAGLVPAPPSSSDIIFSVSSINQLYLIIPPSETTPEMYNGSGDPIGNGTQGWHNEGTTNPGPPPTYYWAIVKTNDCGPPSSGLTFVQNFSQKVCHELAEQCVDRNGTFKEIGDDCVNNSETYRGWPIQKYWSNWDNACISGWLPPLMPRSFQTVDGYKHIFVLGTDGNLWLEKAPFGTAPPSRVQVDSNVFTFQAHDNLTAFVLGNDDTLWLEQGPFGTVPPSRVQVDGSVQAFQGLGPQNVFVLGIAGSLTLEQAPFGVRAPARVHVDTSIKAFDAVDVANVFVLKNNGRLWLKTGPSFKGFLEVDANVRAFQALGGNSQTVWALLNDGTLWRYDYPFGQAHRQQVDVDVLALQVLAGGGVFVLKTDAKLYWVQLAADGFARMQIDSNIMEFAATDASNVLVLKTDGTLWWDQPQGLAPPKSPTLIDNTVA